jgi:outer membrane lipoprotein-sorting protein
MKKVFCIVGLLFWALATLAQTPREILSRMEAEIDRLEDSGVIMTVEVRVPIMGNMVTDTYILGDKKRLEAEMLGVKIITWNDGQTEWTYNSKTNEAEIAPSQPEESSESVDTALFKDITDGYNVKLKKQTDQEWQIECKKRKDNPNEDDPRSMTVVVEKGTYLPLQLSARMSLLVTMTLHDISFGVTEEQVTFNPADYPGVKIKDKR